MPKKESVDTVNLETSLKILESKRGKFDKFKILFSGILIGVIMSALIQLVILPLSFDGSQLTYGDRVLSENVKMNEYLFASVASLCGGLVAIVLLYKRFVIGITPRETAELNYSGDLKEIHGNLTKVLSVRCSTLDGNVKPKVPNNQEIVCYDTGAKENILEITFKPEIKTLKIKFMPENEDSMALIDKIRELYG